MPTFSPSTASEFVKLTSVEVTIPDTLTNALDIRDADNNSYEAINMEMFEEFSVTMRNTGGTDITDVKVEHSPDNENWEADPTIESTNYFDNLLAGDMRSLENITNIRSFFRIRAQVAAGSTTLVVTISARARR